MTGMVELQIINKVLVDNNINLLSDNNITVDDFSEAYVTEMRFIQDHLNTYNNVPDAPTFLSKFPTFDIVTVTEQEKYLVKTFYSELLYRSQLELANSWGNELNNPDPYKSFEHLTKKIAEVQRILGRQTGGIDLTKDLDRLELHKAVMSGEGAQGIKTGIEPLDEAINAILPDDLLVLAARTNMGKSFLGQKILVNIWQQGKKILMYSGENSATTMGYRFDTLYKNYNNTALRFGKDKEGSTIDLDHYTKYWNTLMGEDTPFILITPRDLNGERLNVPMLRRLVDAHNPDIICLDQLSLMDDHRSRRNDNERMAYSHIMQDLRLFVDEYRIPIIVISQTNRNSAIAEDGIIEPPRIEDLAESDGVGQSAKKVVTFSVNNDVLHVIVRKNTDGEKEGTFKMLWNINLGIFAPFTTPEPQEESMIGAGSVGGEISNEDLMATIKSQESRF